MEWQVCGGGPELKGIGMRILVTGATGFIGRHLVPRLLASGHTVVAAGRDQKEARNLPWYDQVDFKECDIYSPARDNWGYLGEPEVAIHLAWAGLPNYEQLFHVEDNLPANYRFLKTLIDGGVNHLLVTGTCLEYGLREGCLSEDMPSAPTNPYALAKDTLRRSLAMLIGHKEITFQWARLFYMYGPGQNPKSLLAQLDRAIEQGDRVFNMSQGEQLRDYLPVESVAERLATLAGYPQSVVVNICSGQPISVRRLVEQHLAKRKSDISLNLGYYPYPSYEPMAFWGDSRRFLSITDSRPCTA
jgi:nucleoside-diphosphate-sugar epimerase